MRYIVLILMTLLLMTGCSAGNATSDQPDASSPAASLVDETVIPSESALLAPVEAEGTSLTEEELAWFNEVFFNQELYHMPNQFLTCLYDRPEDIDLYEIFYNYSEEISEAELTQLAGLGMELEFDECKVSATYIDEVMTRYAGVTLEQIGEEEISHYVYLPDYDAYYHTVSDTNYCQFTMESGQRLADGTVRLQYLDREVTLIPYEDSYRFVSNTLGGATLTEEELAWFNESFFNQSDGVTNAFLTDLYGGPDAISLFELFLYGAGAETQVTQEELELLGKYHGSGFESQEVTKITQEQMETVLLRYTGCSMKESLQYDLDQFVYLREYDAYYAVHGAAPTERVEIRSGRKLLDGTVYLQYADREVVLIPNAAGNGYWFLSNLLDIA